MLTPLQKDALTEILNVQLGMSSCLLSEMVGQKIILSVPEVDLKNGAELNSSVLKKGGLLDAGNFVITSVAFGKEFQGNALIVFPQDKATVLVKACLGEQTDGAGVGLTSLDADVIKEISNIILNSIVGEFGNLLDTKLEYTSFELNYSADGLDNHKFIPENSHVLMLYTSFLLTKSQIRGVIFVALSASSFDMLLDKINIMLQDII
jgi:chemotaxis protein CheC